MTRDLHDLLNTLDSYVPPVKMARLRRAIKDTEIQAELVGKLRRVYTVQANEYAAAADLRRTLRGPHSDIDAPRRDNSDRPVLSVEDSRRVDCVRTGDLNAVVVTNKVTGAKLECTGLDCGRVRFDQVDS